VPLFVLRDIVSIDSLPSAELAQITYSHPTRITESANLTGAFGTHHAMTAKARAMCVGHLFSLIESIYEIFLFVYGAVVDSLD
jgi:hypothetical protein